MRVESMQIKKPMVWVIAEPNGSGKSNLTQYFEKMVNIQMRMM